VAPAGSTAGRASRRRRTVADACCTHAGIVGSMHNAWLLSVLSRDASGLLIAAAVAALGAALRWLGAPSGVSWLLLAVAALLAAGALRHLLQVRRVMTQHPAPGRMIDAGGFRLHLLAEGPPIGVTLLWIAGGYASAAPMAHFHLALRTHARSLMLDRPGTGWSDVPTFPRSTAGEAAEIWRVLDAAGEQGPFIIAGHSFGGLLAANLARRRPGAIVSLVLLDATPPDTILYGPRLGNLKLMSRQAFFGGLLRLFGGREAAYERRQREDPQYAELMKTILAVMGEAGRVDRALMLRARRHFASASIYRELTPEGMVACAWDTAVYDGALDGMRVLVVAPGTSGESALLPEVADAEASEALRMQAFFPKSRESWMQVSDCAVRVIAPAGTGHNFPYEKPQFVVELMINEVRRDQALAPQTEAVS